MKLSDKYYNFNNYHEDKEKSKKHWKNYIILK
jgi:hypothetical protein